jgi:hypothetical protein
MVMNINFPVFVLAKDCGEVTAFDTIEKMQSQLEKIDVENNEYEAWDRNGNPLALGVQKPTWLRIEASNESSTTLRDALLKYGKSVGVQLTDDKANDFVEALKTIEATHSEKPRSKLLSSLFKRSDS